MPEGCRSESCRSTMASWSASTFKSCRRRELTVSPSRVVVSSSRALLADLLPDGVNCCALISSERCCISGEEEGIDVLIMVVLPPSSSDESNSMTSDFTISFVHQ